MTNVVAVTVYAGSEELVAMTERMLNQLLDTTGGVPIVAVANFPERCVDRRICTHHILHEQNLGFGVAVNAALRLMLDREPDCTHALILNNDLEFPDPKWFEALVAEAERSAICAPCTDRTATGAAIAKGAVDKPPTFHPQVSAYAWLVPIAVINNIYRAFGFELFDPDFFAYGEDDYTGAIMRKMYGRKPFKVVHRSWVKHLKGRTGAEFGLGGGMPANLKKLKQKMRANRLS